MIDDSLMTEFFIDTQGHLENIEEDTLRLEKTPSDQELIGDVFRRVHSIKGNAGIMGLGGIYTYGQEFESFLEGIRERKTATPGEIEKIFKYLDGLKANMMALKGETPGPVGEERLEVQSGSAPDADEEESYDYETEHVGSRQSLQEPAPGISGGDIRQAAAEAQEALKISGQLTVLTFQLGHEIYGVDIMRVKEIITYERVTRVPNTKWFVEGVMNLRDQVIPVFDLRKKLKIKSANGDAGVSRDRSIIVVDISKVVTGLVVDDVTGIKVFEKAAITPPRAFEGKISAEYLSGVGQLDDGAVIILNVIDICDPVELLY